MNTPTSQRGPGAGRIIYTIAFTNFALPFMFSGVGVTLPAMSRDLSMGGATLGLFETLYLGVAAAMILPAGRLGDVGDKASFFCWGIAGFTLSTLVLGLSQNVPMILAARVAQGLTVAFIGATNMAILAETVPRERLGRAMGLNIGAVYVGLSAGPFMAGLVTTYIGWRWVYLISTVMSTIAFTLSMRGLQRRWKPLHLDFDWPGAGLSAAGLLLLIAGSATIGTSNLGWLLVGLGLASLFAFIRVELTSRSPLVAIDILKAHPVLLRALTVQLLTYAGAFGTSFLFSLYLQEVRGWTPEKTGRILMISPVLMALLAPLSGRLADRIRPQLLVTIGVSLICGGTLAALLVPWTGMLTLLIVFLVMHGTGFALYSSPNMKVIMSQAPRERTGMASALASQMRSLGMVFSMMLITIFLAVNLGSEGLASATAATDLVRAMRGALALVGVLALLALLTAWRDNPGTGRRQASQETGD